MNKSKGLGQIVIEIKRTNSFDELNEYLNTLSYEELLEVEALMLLGRGDFITYEESLAQIKKLYNIPSQENKDLAISYLLSKQCLIQYIGEGLITIMKNLEKDTDYPDEEHEYPIDEYKMCVLKDYYQCHSDMEYCPHKRIKEPTYTY
ncbi:MAG: DUF3775 domain-containing protein [Lachnospiraceae bacterium]|nr:DUF3775 domain-containing protein [Lachnospiraceae bacterium]